MDYKEDFKSFSSLMMIPFCTLLCTRSSEIGLKKLESGTDLPPAMEPLSISSNAYALWKYPSPSFVLDDISEKEGEVSGHLP